MISARARYVNFSIKNATKVSPKGRREGVALDPMSRGQFGSQRLRAAQGNDRQLLLSAARAAYDRRIGGSAARQLHSGARSLDPIADRGLARHNAAARLFCQNAQS